MRDLAHYIPAVMFLLAATAMVLRARKHRNRRLFWYCMAGVFAVFAAFKVVPLAPLTSNLARQVSQDSGWYAERRVMQQVMIGVVCLLSLVGIMAMRSYVRPTPRQVIVLAAATVVSALAAIRWTSLHEVDALSAQYPWLTPTLECLCGIVVAVAAHRYTRHSVPELKHGKTRRAARPK